MSETVKIQHETGIAQIAIGPLFFLSEAQLWTDFQSCSPLHNVLFGKYVFLATEQAETYLKICVLIYHLIFFTPQGT